MNAVLADLPGSILKLNSCHANLNLYNKHGMTAVMLASRGRVFRGKKKNRIPTWHRNPGGVAHQARVEV